MQPHDVIRLAIPSIDANDLEVVCNVLASGQLVQGEAVAAFEGAVARFTNASHAVATTNCTSALHLSLVALGIGPGDGVLVPAFSWIATSNVVEIVGARPIFVDIDPATFCMCPNDLTRRIAGIEGSLVLKAMLPVHAFGHMADMPSLSRIAESAGIDIVEDAACALGALREDRHAGTWGRAGCFSFHPRKTITTGEGGLVVTNDVAMATRLRALRNHGQDPTTTTPDFILPGFNARMTEMQAALGLSQLAKLERLLEARRRQARQYDELLTGTDIRTPAGVSERSHAVQAYVVLLPSSVSRDDTIAGLRAAGIESTLGTWHLPMARYYRQKYGYRPGDFPVADSVFRRSLTLPLYESMTTADQRRVVDALMEIVLAAACH